VAAEQGAHIVKTYYCDNFEEVAEGCPVPTIIAGGKKLPEPDALKLAHDSVTHGAVGVDMGRNIWQSDYPVPMIKAVRAIVHKGVDNKEAYGIFLKEKEKEPKQKETKVLKAVSRSGSFD
jgi:putative autoinducer-2 (AI-2) aldolase